MEFFAAEVRGGGRFIKSKILSAVVVFLWEPECVLVVGDEGCGPGGGDADAFPEEREHSWEPDNDGGREHDERDDDGRQKAEQIVWNRHSPLVFPDFVERVARLPDHCLREIFGKDFAAVGHRFGEVFGQFHGRSPFQL